ncbi:hypothetical protein TD95_000215 [Thielaviopsis punctulata]|uniref:Protein transport protein sec16 n=1 Tax=Thielaviopsis punctulata TaxID=72032 RepID=A0A0F4ZCS3_9PEZI|nr:hypothetical protein TD95_000215 [Thielaviopsis punctulata]
MSSSWHPAHIPSGSQSGSAIAAPGEPAKPTLAADDAVFKATPTTDSPPAADNTTALETLATSDAAATPQNHNAPDDSGADAWLQPAATDDESGADAWLEDSAPVEDHSGADARREPAATTGETSGADALMQHDASGADAWLEQEEPVVPTGDDALPQPESTEEAKAIDAWMEPTATEDEWPSFPDSVPQTAEPVAAPPETTEEATVVEVTPNIPEPAAEASIETALVEELPHQAPTENTSTKEAPVEESPTEEASAPAPVAEIVPTSAAQTEVDAEALEAADTYNENLSSPTMSPRYVATKTGHSSTMSFARTAQEVTFTDDEEAEWGVQRTGTDPFKFMSAADRSNSFPVVPPSSHHVRQASQADAVAHANAHTSITATPATGDFDTPHEAHNSIGLDFEDDEDDGWDLKPADEELVGGDVANAESRFEEGLPLISQDSIATPITPAFENAPGANNNGGFFNQTSTQAESKPETDASDFQPTLLERKSTMQAMGGDLATPANDKNLASPLEPMAEESEPEVESQTQEKASAEPLLKDFEDDTNSDDGFFSQVSQQPVAEQAQETKNEESPADTKEPPKEAIEAKWEEAFADDDDIGFLDGEAGASAEVDIDGFLSSDDGSLLDDDDEVPAVTQTVVPAAPATNQYIPQPTNPYAPAQQQATHAVPPPALGAGINPYAPMSAAPAYNAIPPPAQPELKKVASFVDKAKSGYTSPYDLPMDVVKPRKRQPPPAPVVRAPATSAPPMVHPPVTTPGSVAPPPLGSAMPPRSSSMYAPGPTTPGAHEGSVAPPSAGAAPSRPPLKSKNSGFFEDLPIVNKPRPSSRAASTRAGSPGPNSSYFPTQPSPLGPPGPLPPQHHNGPPHLQGHHMNAPPVAAPPTAVPPPPFTPVAPPQPPPANPGLGGLVAPDRTNPYAPQAGGNPQMPSTAPATSRYSPAPPVAGHPAVSAPPAAGNRYSPAPVTSRPSSSYAPAPSQLPHHPRTSSPLAHFEITGSDGQSADRRSLHCDSKTGRAPSLPSTREVEEEPVKATLSPPRASGVESRYSPAAAPVALASIPARSTPPPPAAQNYMPMQPPAQSIISPSKRQNANYAPALSESPRSSYVPQPANEPANRRASSLYTPSAPTSTMPKAAPGQAAMPAPTGTATQYMAPVARTRAPSLKLNLVPPTDGREHDPLQRWQGSPIVSWSSSGNIVTSFPKNVPRYSAGSSVPMMVRAAGEVKVHHIKDMIPMDSRLVLFPGPLKGKGKKKEVVAWLNSGIEAMEKNLSNTQFSGPQTLEQKRDNERVLLWKVLRLLVENDGAVDGTEALEKAAREILTPGVVAPADEAGAPGYLLNGMQSAPGNGAASETSDPTAIETIQKYLAVGNREKAAWAAADKKLWGHAMLISNTVSPELYQKVAQEFVRKEVNFPGHKNESLAALYKVLSGNSEECVDELVPPHARAGMQLVATSTNSGYSSDTLEGLDKWRETVSMILSNRSTDDLKALVSLGDLLASYGRAEAAHVCFIFAKNMAVFGGLDDSRANFVLIGADHRGQADQFAKEYEPLLLSEIFEYGLSLTGSTTALAGAPHLTAYKLQMALSLAEYGYCDKAQQYCEAIMASMSAQTRRSPYHHPILEVAVDDLLKRLRSAPKEESNSWISKPSMNKVSDSMWNRFNKFVAGDADDGTTDASGSDAGGEVGPFARIAGGTPTISRSPSMANINEAYGAPSLAAPLQTALAGGMPPVTPVVPIPAAGRAASRYAPAPMASSSAPSHNPYAPAPISSSVPMSSNYAPASLGVPTLEARPASEYGAPASNYAPSLPGHQSEYGGSRMPSYGASPAAASAEYPNMPSTPGHASATLQSPINLSPQNGVPSSHSHVPQTQSVAALASPPHAMSPGYQPPSYGYEPPSMTPTAPEPEANGSAEEPAPAESSGGFEPPSFQPYGYEPPSYEPDPSPASDNEDEAPKPKKKSFMDDDDDDIPALKKPQQKSKSEIDRENEEMFRRIAEEEAKKAEEEKAAKAKKGWGFGGWFGGAAKKEAPSASAPAEAPKATRANLGEASTFVYDPELKRWVNKKPGAENTEKKAPPPPPRSGSSSNVPSPTMTSTPPKSGTPPPMGRSGSLPPPMGSTPPGPAGGLPRSSSMASLGGGPSRPGTSMSNSSSIDDLLSVAPRTKGKAKKRGGRYVDVMANGKPE